jgi:hypothetical protein
MYSFGVLASVSASLAPTAGRAPNHQNTWGGASVKYTAIVPVPAVSSKPAMQTTCRWPTHIASTTAACGTMLQPGPLLRQHWPACLAPRAHCWESGRLRRRV